jgi:hypothetical protein
MTPIIVFTLAIRICGYAVTAGCRYEPVADFISEDICRAAGSVMMVYPRVNGYKCTITTRTYSVKQNDGNAY